MRARPRKWAGLLLSAVLSFPAGAGTIRFDRDGLNARTSLHFRGTANVLTTVPKGTTGDVLERVELPSGNYGVKVRIAKVGSAGTSLKEGETIWVYYHRDSDLRRVALLDDDGKETLRADEGKWAIALSTFRVPRPDASAPACTDCGVGDHSVPPVTAVSETVESITETVTDAPVLETSEQEMITYINSITANYSKETYESALKRKLGVAEYRALQAQQKSANPTIAATLLTECRKNGIPVELGLALMRAESEFIVDAKSSVGARGLMQLMPSTYDGLSGGKARSRMKEPVLNIQLGTRFLGDLLKKYGGDQDKAVAAYNAGPGTVDRYLAGKRRTLPRETVAHVAKVRNYQGVYAAYQLKSRTQLAAN